ncbi:hypothetical protein CC117_27705 [Parafrankia colletiae]|uniref:Uncharacterized protein n=1 Tax=Parafrankia colletiae TaxID=573497 RepID=A0A1S1QCZ0_9ACTN|nr:hypothetical protein [Parafrankia colletiae]MCK9903906.1 hypothetical protein [Frankia sp. Cpl3]OHV30114.1 hypothetical protein CC117_27705 [Parafrankia colletiae]
MLFDPSLLPTADEADLGEALSAINAELRRRISSDDGGLAALVHQTWPSAVAVLCDVVWDDYPTASAEGVLLADNTTIDVDPDSAPDEWDAISDEVTNLAAVDGAISDDHEHGYLIRFDPPPAAASAPPPATGRDAARS